MLSRLLLVVVAALLAAPETDALGCYHCSDITGTDVDHPLLRSANSAIVPRCSDFDSDDDRFKVTECVAPFTTTCAKSTIGDMVIRGCFDRSEDIGCKEGDQFGICVCDTSFCNGASPLATSLLLMLLPAVLVGRLVV